MNLPFEKSYLYFLLGGVVLICAYAGFKSYQTFNRMISNKKPSLTSLFINFKQKMWMTIGLGITFFGFYFFIISMSSYLLTKEAGLSLFFSMYKQPVYFIYMGLFLFAFLSLSIYFIRMLIKYLYITRSKDL